MSRYFHFKRRIAIIAVIIISIASFWYFENFTLAISHTVINSNKILNEVNVVLISDLHGAIFGPENKLLINRIIEQKPDVVFIAGDMYTSGDARGKETAIRFMSSLAKKVPVYFVSGEHDRDSDYCKQLSEANVNVMNYKRQSLNIDGDNICVYGIDNEFYSENFDLKNEWNSPKADKFAILLSHDPTYFPAFADWGADLVLAGDTHGGYMRFPLLGPLIYEDKGNWFPKFTYSREIIYAGGVHVKDGMYDKGLFERDGKYMYVTGGLGSYPIPVRLFNRPEIVHITIK